MSGIAYSAIMLGVLLPKLNIWMTRGTHNKKQNIPNDEKTNNITFKSGFVSMEEFSKKIQDKK
jgi:hypothetical protein